MIYILFHIVQRLCPNDLHLVLTELHHARADWYNIGLSLELSPCDLKAMRGPNKDPKDCLRDMVETWLDTTLDPCWESLFKALKSVVVGRNALARELENKYGNQEQCQGKQNCKTKANTLGVVYSMYIPLK